MNHLNNALSEMKLRPHLLVDPGAPSSGKSLFFFQNMATKNITNSVLIVTSKLLCGNFRCQILTYK